MAAKPTRRCAGFKLNKLTTNIHAGMPVVVTNIYDAKKFMWKIQLLLHRENMLKKYSCRYAGIRLFINE